MPISFTPRAGNTVQQGITDAIATAKAHDISVLVKVNGVAVPVDKDTTPATAYKTYKRLIARRQAKRKASVTKAATTPLTGLDGVVPSVVMDALNDYGHLVLMNENGFGAAADRAESAWTKTRRRLIAWAKRKAKTKRIIFMHAHRPNP